MRESKEVGEGLPPAMTISYSSLIAAGVDIDALLSISSARLNTLHASAERHL
jgi:hypothetical protein